MMMESVSSELEELMLCGCCKQKFNDTDLSPKLLACKHYFCLHCMRTALNKGHELYCVHCWKRTELGPELGPESLPTYAPVLCLTKNFAQLKMGAKSPTGVGMMTPQDKQQQQQQLTPPSSISTVMQQQQQQVQQQHNKVISENCHTHAMPLALWCQSCCASVCRACASTSDHANHQIKSLNEAKDQLLADLHLDLSSMGKMLSEVQRLAMQQREFLLKILEACVTLKTHVEADLTTNASHIELNETRDLLAKVRMNLGRVDSLHDAQNLYATMNLEKQRMQVRYQEMFLQCQLDDLIRNSTVVFDFQLLKQALVNIQNGEMPYPGNSRLLASAASQQNPILFLANYCMSQLYSRHVVTKQVNGNIDYHHHSHSHSHNHHNAVQISLPQQQSVVQAPPNYLNHTTPQQLLLQQQPSLQQQHHQHQQQATKQLYDNMMGMMQQQHSPHHQIPRNVCPLYYFNVEVNGTPMGRIVIEVRADVAPKMAKNFGLLATGETGVGYKGCSIFQCWDGESVITGDFELNNGRGGRSIFEDAFFLPDDTKLMAVRGTVGMRRTQKRHDNMGMVGSQFRVILQEMRGFTGIFGHVVEGLELVEKISTYGDTAGKPTKSILIVKCGKL